MLSPRSLLIRLFDAENRRDWTTYRRLLHPDVEWFLVGRSTESIRGIDSYMLRLESAYADEPAARFRVRRWLPGHDGLCAAELVDGAGRVSLDVFEVHDERVHREWEFLLGKDANTDPEAAAHRSAD